ncbi:MAG TPA: 2-hydroxyacyl-CoA dehydratase family protein [Chloroflexota bacterium]|nr:2-hydroxyacyl-CoA dehydratase family protein [Chloroflexota bacterium]
MTAEPARPRRLKSVDAIRAHQRAWLAETRERALRGEPFAICNSDECEEILTALDVPMVVINYWSAVIAREGKTRHFADVLRAHGYPAAPSHALGFGTTLDPENAPWGGLPQPAIIVGSTRDEGYLRVAELWARQVGCPVFPLDFNFVGQFSVTLPPDWWTRMRDDWESVVDPHRLALRHEQLKGLVAYLELLLGRPLSLARLREVVEQRNRQMDLWIEARDLIAHARPCPVSLRDQLALYQVTWQRGTETSYRLLHDYYEEVKALLADGAEAAPPERYRILMATTGPDPAFHAYLRERHGAVIVTNNYMAIAELYAGTIHDDDPLRLLAARQLFLFEKEPHWYVMQARQWGVDAVIGLEAPSGYPSEYRQVIEAAGFPYLALPRDADDPEVRAMLDTFVATRLA